MKTRRDETLESYNTHQQEYLEQSPTEVTGAMADWLDKVIELVPPSETLFEIGSGTGRDYHYLTAAGVSVIPSDGSATFVSALRESGIPAVHFDMKTDDLPAVYGVLANAVFLHLNESELENLLGYIHDILPPGGMLAFSMKRGTGEEISLEKLNAPRYFRYWQPAELEKMLAELNFEMVYSMAGDLWLHYIYLAREREGVSCFRELE